MAARTSEKLFRIEDPDDYRRLREALAAAGYNDKGVSDTLGDNASTQDRKQLQVLLRRTGGGTPLETLVRLFVLGHREPAGRAAAALAPMGTEWWAERGLVEVSDGGVQAAVQLRCYQGLVVAFDFNRRGGAPLPRDYVMGISPSSLTLTGLTIRTPSRATLDVGTGCGFQAFVATKHSERVVATDRNPRAVECAAFNARLNDLPNVDCREGDLFEPVAGETFDLIVSNPPFIISPDNVFLFLHSGMAGDDVCRTIARVAPTHLNPGGYCQFLANWAVADGEDWRTRLAGWFEGTGCDALVLRRGSTSPDEYAATWIENQPGDEAGFEKSFGAWMDYYGRLGIERIDSGCITLRRPSRPSAGGPPLGTWFRAEDAPDTMSFPAGADIAARFGAEDFLAAHPDDGALLATPFRLSEDVRLDTQSMQAGGNWEAATTVIRRTSGLHWSGGVDADGAWVLARCDGTRPLGALLSELSRSLGPGADDVAQAWPATVRRLVECGFLLPG